jgi:hypothetical protein
MPQSRTPSVFTLEARDLLKKLTNIAAATPHPWQDIFSIPATYWKFGATYL